MSDKIKIMFAALVFVSCLAVLLDIGTKSLIEGLDIYAKAKLERCNEYGEIKNLETKYSESGTCWVKDGNDWNIVNF